VSLDFFRNYSSTHWAFGGYSDEAKTAAFALAYFKRILLPHLSKDRNARILDVGCGDGRYMKALVENGYYNIFGIDISEEQVEDARNRLGLDRVAVADALEFLRAQERHYDAILMIDILEHLDLDYSIKVLTAARAALKDNGIVLVQVPNSISPLSFYIYGDLTHKRAYTVDSIRQTMLLASFRDDAISYYALPPVSSGVIGLIRNVLWHLLWRPLIAAYVTTMIGRQHNHGIYTANMLTVARKCHKQRGSGLS
jgi:2-polyprenyl-3-methyl-5-hydroxy-6-metoxy-1,4-benzoquinol methylase